MPVIEIADFSGGLNTEQNALSLSTNEATILENFIPEYGKLVRRKGFSLRTSFLDTVVGCFYANVTRKWYIVTRTWKLYEYDRVSNTATYVGTISGTIQYPKFAYFDPYLCIATGGSLWLYNVNTKALTQTTSPPCVDVLVKDGRVWIAGGDEVWASRVGDPTDWRNVGGDNTSAQYLQVGYKDGGRIKAFAPLFGDIIVAKDTGLYRIIGSFPSLVVGRVSRDPTCINNMSLLSIGTDVIGVDEQGAYMVSSVMRYGDLAINTIDAKVKTFLRTQYQGAIFHLPSVQAIAFKIRDGYLMYFYQQKVWSIWKNALKLEYLSDNGEVLFGFNTNLFEYGGDGDTYSPQIWDMQNSKIADERRGTSQNVPINAIYRSKMFSSPKPLTITRCGIAIHKRIAATDDVVVVRVGKASHSFTFPKTSPEIWEMRDTRIYGYQREIFTLPPKTTLYAWQTQRVDVFDVYLFTNSDVAIQSLFVEIGG